MKSGNVEWNTVSSERTDSELGGRREEGSVPSSAYDRRDGVVDAFFVESHVLQHG